MTIILNNEGITQNSFDIYKESAMGNLNWQTKNIEAIERFFVMENPTPGGAGSIVVSLLMLITCTFVKFIL